MKSLHQIPFLRILLLFCAGIVTNLLFPDFTLPQWTPLPLFLLVVVTSPNLGSRQYHLRWLFGASFALFLLSLGIIRTKQTQAILWGRESISSTFLLAEINEIPQEKPNSFGAIARLCGEGVPQGSSVMLYIAKDSLSADLSFGDLILFPSDMVKEERNDEFTQYLHSIGCSGSLYLPRNKWRRIGKSNRFSITNEAQKARQKVERIYERTGLEGEELSILCALTLGDKRHLSQELKSSYSATGASHILAVSGLHVGIIYLVLLALLRRLLPGERLRFARIPITLLALWSYAFIAGLSASVVRASTMLSLVAIGEMIGRKSGTLNTVFASAFCMLLYRPQYITDIGFQLSYAAVISILLLQEKIYKTFTTKNFIIDKIWSLTSVSIAAQLGTLPIVLYHFHQFSNLFWLSGLIVIPTATLLIYASALLLITTSFPTISGWIAHLLQTVTSWMNQCIRWMEQLPHAAIKEIPYNGTDILLFYLILAALLATMKLRSFQRMTITLSLLLSYTTYLTILKWINC